ncbi:YlxQ family RNA-binding protein [Shimazuella sp. KC615]|uniref:YlxQ family RNA-binding protein n=2 Tax=Shimazuella alba TaxID=2690964 RepID=A0A6I4VYT2_9BACL|nr:YlxQ family RNA-binding protein [Shimazuella alba]
MQRESLMKNNFFQVLGLAQRARKLTLGEEFVLQSVRNGQAKLVILATDAGKNTTKKITDKCNSYDVPLLQVGTRVDLGTAVGKGERVVMAVTDSGFCQMLRGLVT